MSSSVMRRRVLGAFLGAVALVVLTGASPPAPAPLPPAAGAASEARGDDDPRAPTRSRSAPPPSEPRPRSEGDAGGAARTSRGSRAGRSTARCPADMIYVDGIACDEVEQRCLEWLPQLPGSPPRCAVFAPNSVCAGATARARFCIDRFEYPNREGELPVVMRTWEQAQAACHARGRRLCQSKEWTLACEGEARLPYPYGHVRDEQACNVDRPMHVPHSVSARAAKGAKDGPPDWRVASGEMNRCVSPFGVHDMTGNVDEWVVNESGHPYASGLKGGFWGPVRDRCRTMTVAHDEKFAYYQIGFRCCDDPAR